MGRLQYSKREVWRPSWHCICTGHHLLWCGCERSGKTQQALTKKAVVDWTQLLACVLSPSPTSVCRNPKNQLKAWHPLPCFELGHLLHMCLATPTCVEDACACLCGRCPMHMLGPNIVSIAPGHILPWGSFTERIFQENEGVLVQVPIFV